MLAVPAPALVHAPRLADEIAAAGYSEVVIALTPADVVEVHVYGQRADGEDIAEGDRQTIAAVVAAHVPPPSPDDRLAAVEAELRGMRERAAAATVTGDAAAVRDAITGKSA
jgi:hypothetical protein